MVMMKNSVIMATCLLLLSSLALQAYASTYGPDECCFKFVPKLPKKGVLSFRRTESLCPMRGVLFAMRNGRVYCVDESQQWVKNIIKNLEEAQTKEVTNSTVTSITQ